MLKYNEWSGIFFGKLPLWNNDKIWQKFLLSAPCPKKSQQEAIEVFCVCNAHMLSKNFVVLHC